MEATRLKVILILNLNVSQEEVEDVFCFVTFVVNSAVIVLQCVLSVLLDKPSGYRHVGVDDSDVRDYSNRTVKI